MLVFITCAILAGCNPPGEAAMEQINSTSISRINILVEDSLPISIPAPTQKITPETVIKKSAVINKPSFNTDCNFGWRNIGNRAVKGFCSLPEAN
jgi:hypothetical protein